MSKSSLMSHQRKILTRAQFAFWLHTMRFKTNNKSHNEEALTHFQLSTLKIHHYFPLTIYFLSSSFQKEQFLLLWMLLVTIVVGNVSVLIILYRNRKRRSRVNLFIQHLAIAGKNNTKDSLIFSWWDVALKGISDAWKINARKTRRNL